MRKLEKKVQILPNHRPKISGWKSTSQQSIKNIELNFRMKPYFVKYSFSLNKYLHTLALAWQVLQRIQAKQNHIESKQCRIEPIYINSVISNKNYISSTISNVMKLNGWEHHIFPFSIGSIEKGYIMSKIEIYITSQMIENWFIILPMIVIGYYRSTHRRAGQAMP